MIKKLFYLFIFFAPFTSFFALSGWLRLPVIINQLLFLVVVIGLLKNNKLKIRWITKEDLYLLSFLGLVWLSFLLGFKEKRSFNHTLAYTNAIFLFFFLTKYVINLLKVSSLQIARIIYYSFLLISFIVVADFIGKNYFNFKLREIYTTLDGAISNMSYFIRLKMYRVGGVAEEPGTMALFYNLYFGVSMYYLYLSKKVKKYFILLSLFIACHYFMMSNAGIVLPIIAVLIIFIINKISKLTITQNQIFWTLSIIVLLITATIAIMYFNVENSAQVAEEFLNKILFNEDHKSYSSSGQRLKQWGRALSNFVDHPVFGHGPGFGVHQDQEGYLSVYFTILADIGIIAFLLFISFQQSLIKKVMRFSLPVRSFILFSVITSFLHLIIVSDFYHAPIWLLFVIIQLVYKEQKLALV